MKGSVVKRTLVRVTEIDTKSDVVAVDICVQLKRILSDARFEGAPQRRKFLRYVVEETLAGRGDRLKGYTIATAVFGRGDDFDPRSDPVVRIEARRLRRDLHSYYMEHGRDDPILISIPKGRYLPSFERREGARGAESPTEAEDETFAPPTPGTEWDGAAPVARSAPPTPRRRSGRWRAAAFAAIAVILAIGAVADFPYLGRALGPSKNGLREPTIVVLPFKPENHTEASRILANGIPHELIDKLMRFPDFRLFWVSEDQKAADTEELSADLPDEVAYVVTGEVAVRNAQIRLSARLLDRRTRRVIWSEIYERDQTAADLLDLRAEMAGEIATALGQPYGVVRNDIVDGAIDYMPSELTSYHCVLRAHQYRRRFGAEERAGVRACLETAVRDEPRYATAWAMLGWVLLDEGRFTNLSLDQTAPAYDAALAAASRALELDPENTDALKALSAIHHYRGDYDRSEALARAALTLNPFDPDTMAQLGWRLAARGSFEEGIPLIKQAIARSIRPPGWYHDWIAIDFLLRNEYKEMLAVVELPGRQGSAVNQALLAIAQAHLGNGTAARTALSRMAELWSPLAEDPSAYWRAGRVADVIVHELDKGLILAGWRPPEPARPTSLPQP